MNQEPNAGCDAGRKTKVLTLRLPADMAREAEIVAHIEGIHFSELVRVAIHEYLRRRGGSDEFQSRLSARLEQDKRIITRLTDKADPS